MESDEFLSKLRELDKQSKSYSRFISKVLTPEQRKVVCDRLNEEMANEKKVQQYKSFIGLISVLIEYVSVKNGLDRRGYAFNKFAEMGNKTTLEECKELAKSIYQEGFKEYREHHPGTQGYEFIQLTKDEITQMYSTMSVVGTSFLPGFPDRILPECFSSEFKMNLEELFGSLKDI